MYGSRSRRQRVQPLERVLRLDDVLARAVVAQAVARPPCIDLPPPGVRARRRRACRRDLFPPRREQRRQRLAAIAEQRQIDPHVLVDRGRVDVDVDLLRIRRKRVEPSRHPVVEARADRDHEVAIVHRHVRLVRAVHADHAEEMRVARRQRAEPHQGQGARRIDQPHEFGKAGAGLGAGIDQPAAAVKQRPFRRRDQLDGLGDARRVGLHLRPVGLVRRLLGRGVCPEREQHVLRQIDDDRAGPPALRDIKRLVQRAPEVGDILDEIIVLGAGPRDAGRVGFLKRVVADQMRRHLPGQADDRHRIHQRVGQPGHGVGRAGTARHQHDADLAGRARVALGGVHRAALLAHQDVAQRVLLEERIVNRQDRAAGIAEYDIDALIDERLDDDIRSADRLGRHDALRQYARKKRQIPPGGPPVGGPGERHPNQLGSGRSTGIGQQNDVSTAANFPNIAH